MLLVFNGVTSPSSGLSYLDNAPDKYIFIILASYLELLKPTTGTSRSHFINLFSLFSALILSLSFLARLNLNSRYSTICLYFSILIS